ncbi:MAG: hypothetical protein IT303_16905 [Dehalococcoidia bacterium]|nr:hypothetical protein [Dehalococcoidia bacterium]
MTGDEHAEEADYGEDFGVDESAGIRMLTPEEARAYFDAEVRRELGISGDEFLANYHAGVYVGHEDDTPQLRWCLALLPWGEPGYERRGVPVSI